MLSFSLVAEALTGLIYHRPSGENFSSLRRGSPFNAEHGAAKQQHARPSVKREWRGSAFFFSCGFRLYCRRASAEENEEIQLIAVTTYVMTYSRARAPELRMITPTEMIKHHSNREQTLYLPQYPSGHF